MIQNITKLVLDGLYKEAIISYTQLLSCGFKPNNFTFPFLLKACKNLRTPSHGQMIHAHVVKTGFNTHIHTATSLINIYMKFGSAEDAFKVFDKMPHRNVASFNAVVCGFLQNGYFREAIWVFKLVGLWGFRPNSVTLASVLPACEVVEHGLQVHGLAINMGLDLDVYVATAILTMYSNFGELGSVLCVFGLIEEKSVVSYNALISGLVHNKWPLMVSSVFNEMRAFCGQRFSSVTLISVLCACSDMADLKFGRQIHCLVMKFKVGSDVKIATSLIDMYSKCGSLKWAYQVFMELRNKNLVTWNSLISGMFSHGHCDVAVELFEQLESQGFEPDIATWNVMVSGFSRQGNGVEAFRYFRTMNLKARVGSPSLKLITSLLPVCSTLSYLDYGKEIHGRMIRTVADQDDFILTALIDMYMKCGCSRLALRIFDRIERKVVSDPVMWNAMIAGYGRNGENELALEIFDRMVGERVVPNSATFVSVLSVCGHGGWVDKGLEMFRKMNRDHGILPNEEHFGCMVDLLGRSGKLQEAQDLIRELSEPSSSVYASLLGACRCHGDAELGEEMAQRLIELEPNNPIPFVILSNMYAEKGRWSDVERVRMMMNDRGLKKIPGCSWIGVTHQIV